MKFVIALILVFSSTTFADPLVWTDHDDLTEAQSRFYKLCKDKAMVLVDIEKLGQMSLTGRKAAIFAWYFPVPRFRSGWKSETYAGEILSAGSQKIRIASKGKTKQLDIRDTSTIEICVR